MTPEQRERVIVAEEKKAEALIMIASILQRWYDSAYPILPAAVEGSAEVYKVGDTKPEPDSLEAYREFPTNEKGRFENLIEKFKTSAR